MAKPTEHKSHQMEFASSESMAKPMEHCPHHTGLASGDSRAEPMKHSPHPTGFALGITAGVVYALCAAAVAHWPSGTIQFFNNWFHGMDITRLASEKTLTFGNFFGGLIGIVVFGYLVGLLYAWIYNRCLAHCKRWGWI